MICALALYLAPYKKKMSFLSFGSFVVVTYHSQASILHGIQEGQSISVEKRRPPYADVNGPGSVSQLLIVHLVCDALDKIGYGFGAPGLGGCRRGAAPRLSAPVRRP